MLDQAEQLRRLAMERSRPGGTGLASGTRAADGNAETFSYRLGRACRRLLSVDSTFGTLTIKPRPVVAPSGTAAGTPPGATTGRGFMADVLDVNQKKD
jgi:hypothetical protein